MCGHEFQNAAEQSIGFSARIEFGRADVAGDFHTAMASSRTKWRRMIFGIGPGTSPLK
jgi:hypothetical protein